ncbi:MAG: putative glycoside hydrolase [Bacteroides sp.]|nr:putative glycoside hydrolase [Bacteroides sp.]
MRKVTTVLSIIILTASTWISAEDPLKDKDPLLISDGSRFVPKEYYPKFNWDQSPQYFMFGIADGSRVLQPEEVSFIAKRTDFICIEKSHAYKLLGGAELGAQHEAAAFKKIKPGIKVLFYFNSAYAWPFTSYNQYFTADKIDQHPELKQYLIVDPETGELARRGSTFFFDVLNPEFRAWWIETVASGVKVSGCDGVFIDQMHGFFWLREDQKEEVHKAMGEMMAGLKKKMGPDKILLGNNAADEIAKYVYPHIDANMFEHYNSQRTSKENLLIEWEDMLDIARDGKISVFRFGVEVEGTQLENASREEKAEGMAKLSQDRLEFYLACYLIGAQPYSYFQYGWGWRLSTGPLVDYPELLKPLGPPKGAYQRTSPDGWEFTREFEHTSVWVDTEKREARITWH